MQLIEYNADLDSIILLETTIRNEKSTYNI